MFWKLSAHWYCKFQYANLHKRMCTLYIQCLQSADVVVEFLYSKNVCPTKRSNELTYSHYSDRTNKTTWKYKNQAIIIVHEHNPWSKKSCIKSM